ncbi:hypothetical protein IQ255_06860 [Pleurocapsales cyanobacterium LEGE 10410]|nr:hypothetical protein [Pleurocapsales cyanobacterium LEGE 10410]
MATKERINNIKITLPLIALCLPLFVKYQVTAENGCPYETYIRVDGKCLDISKQGLEEIAEEFDDNLAKEVNQEVNQVSKELEELSEELDELCVEQPETMTQSEILENVCQD